MVVVGYQRPSGVYSDRDHASLYGVYHETGGHEAVARLLPR